MQIYECTKAVLNARFWSSHSLLLQHLSSTQGPLLLSPRKLSVQHVTCVSSTSKKASVQHICGSTTQKASVEHKESVNVELTFFVLNRRFLYVELTVFCVELTDFGGRKGVALLC